MSIGRFLTTEEITRRTETAAATERVRVVVLEALTAGFGPDNAQRYEDDPTMFGVSVDEHMVNVKVGYNEGEYTMRPRPQDAPSLLFNDGHTVRRIDIPVAVGAFYDRRTRALMQALLNVASEHLDDMENSEARTQ